MRNYNKYNVVPSSPLSPLTVADLRGHKYEGRWFEIAEKGNGANPQHQASVVLLAQVDGGKYALIALNGNRMIAPSTAVEAAPAWHRYVVLRELAINATFTTFTTAP